MGAKISTEILHFDLQQEIDDADDYDHRLVRKLIRLGRLASCYKGLSEKPSQPPRFEDVVSTTNKSPFLPREFMTRRIDPRLYEQVIECPICLLYYPIYINYSRCCNQPICTECFLKLKRPPLSPMQAPACPFCVQPSFGVIYIPPSFTGHDQALNKRRNDQSLSINEDTSSSPSSQRRQQRLALDAPDVVLADSIRPNWHKMIDAGIRAGSISGHGTTRRRVVRLSNHHATATHGVGHIRVGDSPYYGSSLAWERDESAAVMNAIRGQQV